MPDIMLQHAEPEHLQADAKMSTSLIFSAVICVGEKPRCPSWKETVLYYKCITKGDKLLYLVTDFWQLSPFLMLCCLKLEMSWTDPKSISIWDTFWSREKWRAISWNRASWDDQERTPAYSASFCFWRWGKAQGEGRGCQKALSLPMYTKTTSSNILAEGRFHLLRGTLKMQPSKVS